MSCNYHEEPLHDIRHGADINDFEAVLCGLFTYIERFSTSGVEGYLNGVDWKEVGVPRSVVENWWEHHKKEDEERRAREAAEKLKEKIRAEALKKLSVEERIALGLFS
jgi:hypothetical protein